jgi:gamma-glutamylputrescine oxidase
MTIEALDIIRERRARFAIDCEWQDGFLNVAVTAAKGRQLQDWAERMARGYGYPMRQIAAPDMGAWIASRRYVSAVHDPRCGHLHPLKYVLGLARAAASLGVTIHEHTSAIELIPGERPTLRAAQGMLRARQVLLAGNVYLDALAPRIARRIMPVGTYVAASQALPRGLAASLIPSGSAVCDNNVVLDYFRLSKDCRMIFGGLASYGTKTPRRLAEKMRRRMLHVFPQLAPYRVEHTWGGFIDITMNRAPDFGRLPAAGAYAPNVYYLQGFSGHGLALAGLAGRLVAEAIGGDASRFDVFSRLKHRTFPGGRMLRTPALVLGMAWYRLHDAMA